MIARLFRIWPALIFTLLVTIFLIGPIFTELSTGNYFSNPGTYTFLIENIKLNTVFVLPGVFNSNPFAGSVNGSLWTIPLEVIAYIILLGLFILGVLKSKILSIVVFLLILLDPFIFDHFIFKSFAGSKDLNLFTPCFAFGCILAVLKEEVRINFWVVSAPWIMFALFLTSAYANYFLFLSFFLSILYLSSFKIMLKIKPKSDFSYGVYLWGFTVQQMMKNLFPKTSTEFNQISSLILSLILGYISWHLIEKKFINFGSRLSRNLQPRYQKFFDRIKLPPVKSGA